MAFARFQSLRRLHRALQPQQFSSLSQPSPTYLESGKVFTHRSIMTSPFKISSIIDQNTSGSLLLRSMNAKVSQVTIYFRGARTMSSSAKVPAGARPVSVKVVMQSPGIVYEPYKSREPISFWRRWFTRSGWIRTKEDIILEMRSAYAITRLKKVTGYSKKLFYQHAVRIYKEINTLLAKGNTSALRKAVTENMYSTLKNEIKRRESMWSSVYWELIEPVVSIRTMRARMIALDKNDLDKAFIQLTLEFVSKQRFEACDSKGIVVSGDRTKVVLVRDIWVFERSLFHTKADWRLCARLPL